MESSDRLTPAQAADLLSAARAAASWARARRATWTDTPLPVFTSPPPTFQERMQAGAAMAARVAEHGRNLGAAVAPWLPKMAVVAAALVAAAAVAAGGRYLWNAVTPSAPTLPVSKVAPPPPPKAAVPVANNSKGTGGLRVSSTPAGAQVSVDGKNRGITPLTLTDLATGRHVVELRSGGGMVQRTVAIAPNRTTEIDEPMFSGWLAVYSPFELVVSEGGRALRLDERNQAMLPPGRHTVRLANRTLAYDEVREVDLRPGETTSVTVTPQPSTMTVTSTEPAEVWLDGVQVGDTPVSARPVELGTHEIIVRRAAGDNRRFTVTVTVKPLTLNVDFSKPGA